MKKNNKKGFTLAELLIVVAIIAVLVAIAIPVFTAQLNKSKYSTDLANARSIYAELSADYLANGGQQKAVAAPSAITAGSSGNIVVTAADSGQNTYKFTGIVGVTVTGGTTSKGPTVVVDSCTSAGVSAAETFGGTTVGGGT